MVRTIKISPRLEGTSTTIGGLVGLHKYYPPPEFQPQTPTSPEMRTSREGVSPTLQKNVKSLFQIGQKWHVHYVGERAVQDRACIRDGARSSIIAHTIWVPLPHLVRREHEKSDPPLSPQPIAKEAKT